MIRPRNFEDLAAMYEINGMNFMFICIVQHKRLSTFLKIYPKSTGITRCRFLHQAEIHAKPGSGLDHAQRPW